MNYDDLPKPEAEQGFEYGIEHCRYPVPANGPHRWGMTLDEAESFVRDWEDDGCKPGVFRVIRRPVGQWRVINDD